MKRTRLLLAVLFAAAGAISIRAVTIPKVEFTQTKLPNGLRVVISADHAAPVVSMCVVYDVGSSVKFDPARPEDYPHDEIYAKLEYLRGQKWDHQLGDGNASERLVNDLVNAVNSGDIRGHTVEHQHLDVSRSYREDGLPVVSGERA